MRLFISIILTWAVFAVPASADPVVPSADSSTLTFADQSTMTVYGSSNVRDWTMDVKQMSGSVVLGEANEAVPSIQTIRIDVPVQKMVSEKDRLQRHAHEALKKEEHPTISFTASDVQVAKADADSFSVVANGNLTIAGETRSVTLTAKGIQAEDGAISVKGDHRLKLTTFDVERPSLMFGAIKVDNPVRIGFSAVLSPASE